MQLTCQLCLAAAHRPVLYCVLTRVTARHEAVRTRGVILTKEASYEILVTQPLLLTGRYSGLTITHPISALANQRINPQNCYFYALFYSQLCQMNSIAR